MMNLATASVIPQQDLRGIGSSLSIEEKTFALKGDDVREPSAGGG
jgi:hypothetical protein